MPLVTTTEMFKKAYEGGYAIGAFNVNNMEIVQGITEACNEQKSPVILQVSKGARAYANHTYLVKLVEAAIIENPDLPIALHLDHGPDFETCKSCIDGGFTSVMIDGSSLSFEENIAVSKKVVEYAHDHGVVVEAELGTLAGIEDDVNVSAADSSYTRPEDVQEFVERTGCDSLAIAIGTSHGAYKFKPGTKPQLRFDILEEVSKRLPGFPIVLHGSSSVPQEFVQIVNQYGGNMPGAVGVPEDQLRKAASMSVCKINIDSDIRLAITATIRKYMAEHPDHFDPRQYLKPARQAVKDMVARKLVNVLGSNNKICSDALSFRRGGAPPEFLSQTPGGRNAMKDVKAYMHSEVCETNVIHDGAVAKVRANMQDEDPIYEVAELFKVFGDSTRARIICALTISELCVCDLSCLLNMSQSAISHQLRILKQARMVKNRRAGKVVYYSLADAHIKTLFEIAFEHVMED